ncbi:hypothetical protein ET495_09860 [Xylanimonas allomyrinae]|uniref:AbiTii domain-containing protein n=1 Tax=Xylanimonas allomyrinae TaxID=2509459 RepID=A0A4P6F396_9MICO|nr:hypothetical protein ET495_09860 [Xylanimonas allomyrinae]
MNRTDEARQLAEDLLADIEMQRLKASEIALKASRLARLVNHEELMEFLRLERDGYSGAGAAANMWIGRAGRWADADDGKFYPMPLAKVEGMLDASREALQTLRGGGNYSGESVVIAAREHDQKVGAHARAIATFSGITGQVVATVYTAVVEIYHELLFSELQATLFGDTQSRVDGALAEASGSALEKIERVSDRLRDADPESVSQALTTCRRLIDSCAEHLFAARPEKYDIGDGVQLAVGSPNVLNRLQAHAHSTGAPKSRRDRLRRTLSDLYERCSAGTHAEVGVAEARFIFLQTYVALGELLTLGEP